MEADDFDRTLTVEIPPSYFDVDPATGAMTPQTAGAPASSFGGGFTLVPGYTTAIFFQDSIDLSGYAMKDLTFVPYASYLQEGGFIFYNQGVGAYIMDILSSVPIDATEAANAMIFSTTPGFIQTTNQNPAIDLPNHNPDTIIHSQMRFMANDSSFPGNQFLVPELEVFGSSLEPTAADKLYFMRIAIVFKNENPVPPQANYGTQFSLPAARVRIPGRMTKEPEIEYLYRLKRSYELANQV